MVWIEIFIYGLMDPWGDRIFYIGSTMKPYKRLLVHRSSGGCWWSARGKRLAHMGRFDRSPEMILLECCFSEKDAGEAEQRWIDFGFESGWKLSNCKPAPRNGVKDRGLNMVKHARKDTWLPDAFCDHVASRFGAYT